MTIQNITLFVLIAYT